MKRTMTLQAFLALVLTKKAKPIVPVIETPSGPVEVEREGLVGRIFVIDERYWRVAAVTDARIILEE